MIYGSMFRVYGLGFRVHGLWFRVWGVWFMVDGSEFWDEEAQVQGADVSVRALCGRLEFTIRRHNFNNDSLSLQGADAPGGPLASGEATP